MDRGGAAKKKKGFRVGSRASLRCDSRSCGGRSVLRIGQGSGLGVGTDMVWACCGSSPFGAVKLKNKRAKKKKLRGGGGEKNKEDDCLESLPPPPPPFYGHGVLVGCVVVKLSYIGYLFAFIAPAPGVV